MITLEKTQMLPLKITDEGTIQISGSRITLDSIIHHFKMGSIPEEIAHKFPSLKLADIYSTVAYYLCNREMVEEYLKEQETAAEETRNFIESRQDTIALRERILARAEKQKLR